eukprot:1662548-Rhodomonas_salina.2
MIGALILSDPPRSYPILSLHAYKDMPGTPGPDPGPRAHSGAGQDPEGAAGAAEDDRGGQG